MLRSDDEKAPPSERVVKTQESTRYNNFYILFEASLSLDNSKAALAAAIEM